MRTYGSEFYLAVAIIHSSVFAKFFGIFGIVGFLGILQSGTLNPS
jgi:hypothetical protein